MLRVLIERPPTVDEDVGRSKADYTAVAKRYPDVARQLRVSFCGSDEERERMLAKAEVFVGWVFPTAASRAPRAASEMDPAHRRRGRASEALRLDAAGPQAHQLQRRARTQGGGIRHHGAAHAEFPHAPSRHPAAGPSLVSQRLQPDRRPDGGRGRARRHGRRRRRRGQAARAQGHRRQSLRPAEPLLRADPAGRSPP